jgi:PDZ domain-containing protein
MRRRGTTVLLGAVIVLLLGVGIASAPVPYVIEGPGPTVDTLGTDNNKPVIEVSGRPTYRSAGQLRLVTVGVQSDTDLLSALAAWFNGDEAVVPRELIFPPGQSEEEVNQRNEEDFKASQSSAETVALRKLGYPVSVAVTRVIPGRPAAAALQAGDVINSVDGQPVTSRQRLVELITAKPAGTALTIGYTRAGAQHTATIKTVAGDGNTPQIGVEVENRQPHPFDVTFDIDKIGGPSAGLMFALGVIDKLDPVDLTGGKIIAGTGTIDDEGNVGPIGGIPQKLVGAKEAHATVFLTPEDNCAEAVANAQPGMTLVKVGNLDEALSALQALRDGRPAPRC